MIESRTSKLALHVKDEGFDDSKGVDLSTDERN